MVDEAELERTDVGLRPKGAGWFVVNLAQASWKACEGVGTWCSFEGEVPSARFSQFGINVHVLAPGERNCQYHREGAQEDFLVLHGECLVIVEGQERRLVAGDFVHCPPMTTHVFVGAGVGPCAILMVGTRGDEFAIHYPVERAALKHGAGVTIATDDPRVAYADFPASAPVKSPWPLP